MLLLLATTALAADRVEESDTLGMGSTGVAAPHANSMVTANPGGLGLADRYTFSLGGSYGERGLHWNIGAIDTKTSPVAFGLIYSGDQYHPPFQEHELPGYSVAGQELTNKKRTHDFAAALAIPLLDHRFSFGLGGSFSYFNNDRQGKGVTGNVHLGLAFQPHEAVNVGLSARNLLPVVDPSLARPLEFLGGVYVGDRAIGGIAIEGGARPEFSQPLVLAAGAEVFPSKAAVRAGWRYESGIHNLTVGTGGGTDEGRVDLALLVPTPSIVKPLDWTIQLSVRFRGPNTEEIPEPR